MKSRLPLVVPAVSMLAMLTVSCGQKPTREPVVTVASGQVTSSPSGRSAAAGGTAMVRFVNALPGSSALEIRRDSVPLFSNAIFGAVSPYQQVAGDAVQFALRSGASPAPITQSRERLVDGMRYTLIALADARGRVALRLVRDDLVPAEGKARVRVIHAAPGLDDIDVSMSGRKDPLFHDVDFGSEAGFEDVAPTTSGFRVSRANDTTALLRLKSMGLVAGTAYTFVLTSAPRGTLAAIAFSDISSERTATPTTASR